MTLIPRSLDTKIPMLCERSANTAFDTQEALYSLTTDSAELAVFLVTSQDTGGEELLCSDLLSVWSLFQHCSILCNIVMETTLGFKVMKKLQKVECF